MEQKFEFIHEIDEEKIVDRTEIDTVEVEMYASGGDSLAIFILICMLVPILILLIVSLV